VAFSCDGPSFEFFDGQLNEPKHKGKPLRSLDGSSMQNPRNDQSEGQSSDNHSHISSNSRLNNDDSGVSTSSSINESPSASSTNVSATEDSSSDSSIKDLKAAVENIQKMFSIHLMESQQDNDDT
jgi:hypothetical protein